MTIREKIITDTTKAMEIRLKRLIELKAPELIIQAETINLKNVENLKIKDEFNILSEEFCSEEHYKGRGGKTFIIFNKKYAYFPFARFGCFITKSTKYSSTDES